MKGTGSITLFALLVAPVACEQRASSPAQDATLPSALASSAPEALAPPPAPKRPCPDEMAAVDGFCVDLYEAHLERASDRAPHSPYERPKPSDKYVAVSSKGAVPQGYVNRHEAAAACEGAGKRLCRAVEWYRACSGKLAKRFPYGAQLRKSACNVDKGHLLTKVFGNVFFTKDAHYNSPRLNQEPGFLAKTGEYTECASEDGAFDLVGNLHEWVADDVSAKLMKELPLEKGDHWLGKRGMGLFMGGYFSSRGEHGRGCVYATATHAPEYHDYSTGFRCCADAR